MCDRCDLDDTLEHEPDCEMCPNCQNDPDYEEWWWCADGSGPDYLGPCHLCGGPQRIYAAPIRALDLDPAPF